MMTYQGRDRENHFEFQGVSFNYPENWQVTSLEKIEGNYCLAVERKGQGSNGLVVLIWRDRANEEVVLKEIQRMVKNQPSFKNVEFTPTRQIMKFNKKQTISSNFSASGFSSKHSGSIYVFTSSGQTYAFMKKGADNEDAKNKAGFDMMEETLIVS